MTQITAALVKELRERTSLGMMECKKALVESNGEIDLAIDNLRKSSSMKAAKKASRIAAEGIVVSRFDADNQRGILLEVNSETDFVARDENFIAFAELAADTALSSNAESIEALQIDETLSSKRDALVQKIGENITLRRLNVVEGPVVDGYVHGNNKIGVLVALQGGDQSLAKDVAMHVAATNPLVMKADDMPAEQLLKEKEIYMAQAADSGKPADIIEKMVEGRLRKFVAESSLVDQPFVKDPDLTVGKLLKNAQAEILAYLRYEVGDGIEKKVEDFAAEVAAQLQND